MKDALSYMLAWKDLYTKIMDHTDVSNIDHSILLAIVVGLLIYLFTRPNSNGRNVSISDEEYDRALMNSVTYHRTPPPSKSFNYTASPTYRISTSPSTSADKFPPPPRTSLLFASPFAQESISSELALTHNSNHRRVVDDIHFNHSQDSQSISSERMGDNLSNGNVQNQTSRDPSQPLQFQNGYQRHTEENIYYRGTVPFDYGAKEDRLKVNGVFKGSRESVSPLFSTPNRYDTNSEEDIHDENINPPTPSRSNGRSVNNIYAYRY